MSKVLGIIGGIVLTVAIVFCCVAFLPKDTIKKVNDWGNEKMEQIKDNGQTPNQSEEGNTEEGESSNLPSDNIEEEIIREVEQIIL